MNKDKDKKIFEPCIKFKEVSSKQVPVEHVRLIFEYAGQLEPYTLHLYDIQLYVQIIEQLAKELEKNGKYYKEKPLNTAEPFRFLFNIVDAAQEILKSLEEIYSRLDNLQQHNIIKYWASLSPAYVNIELNPDFLIIHDKAK